MNRKRAILVAAAAFGLALAAVYLWGPSSAPSGQEPIFALSDANFNQFANSFDADPDVPRLVLLLSPT
jgi:hypothetical protein